MGHLDILVVASYLSEVPSERRAVHGGPDEGLPITAGLYERDGPLDILDPSDVAEQHPGRADRVERVRRKLVEPELAGHRERVAAERDRLGVARRQHQHPRGLRRHVRLLRRRWRVLHERDALVQVREHPALVPGPPGDVRKA